MTTLQVLAVVLAMCLHRLRARSSSDKLPLWMRLRPMSGGDVVQGSIFGFVTPLGKDTGLRLRRRRAVARAVARRSVNHEHRDRDI